MATVVQQAVTLNSQNQLRNADRLARDWAIAHAGAYQSQARKELGGSLPFREWQDASLTIRLAKLTGGSFKQAQLVSVNYATAGDAEPYAAYVMTYAYSETELSGGHCISVASLPDGLANVEFPWDDKAGPVGLERVIESIKSDRARPSSRAGDAQPVAAIGDLFAVHDTAIVLTESGRDAGEFEELAELHGDWATVVAIGASEQVALSHHLPDDQLRTWLQAKIALFSRYADADGNRLRMAETDFERALTLVDEERDRAVKDIAGSNTIAALQVLESVAIMLSTSTLTDAKDVAEALAESTSQPPPESEEADASDSVAAQQRVFLLEDKLSEAESTISELRERLAQYESYDVENQPAENVVDKVEPVSDVDANRHNTVLAAIADPERLPRLRFLTNCDKPLADYGKPRPNGVEIVAALDAINGLAQAWYNTPNGAIGPWDNYFMSLPGWKHADDESETTMSRYGEKRSFSDQEEDRHVTITRHLTYQGSSGGLQIYFDRDDATDTFIVGYIGEHLPYATARS